MEEMMDIYDEEQRPLGITLPRKDMFLKEDQFALYVLAIIQDKQGQFLITRRSLDKRWAAGWWEVTGGGVSAGETVRDAVLRECSEEVGLDVSACNIEPIYHYKNVDLDRGDNYIVNIFNFQLDFDETDVKLQASEAIDYQLATWNEIEALHKQGIFLHYDRICQALEAKAPR